MEDAVSDSWTFIKDFYNYDNSIVELLNSALRIKSNKRLSQSNIDELLKDIVSLFSSSNENISYKDFLKYVIPEKCYEENDIDKCENNFLNHIWINILSGSEVEPYLPQYIISQIDANPYLILFSMNLCQDCDWLIYGGESRYYFVNDKKNWNDLLKKLNRRYKKWDKWQSKWIYIKSKLFRTRLLLDQQLYPLVVLLIILRREWLYSQNSTYISQKYYLLSMGSNLSNVNLSILYGLYNEYEGRDDSILKEIKHKNIVPAKFHRLIARNIIKNEMYDVLYENIAKENQGEEKGNMYKDTNEYCEKHVDSMSNRLLLDYMFPYTQIRENDVFVPRSLTDPFNLTDKIYLMLRKGTSYEKYYREPKEDEKFSYIQIDPQDDRDMRIRGNRNRLKPEGKFLLVKLKKDFIVREELMKAFSNFRHDLKAIMTDSDIKNLQYAFGRTEQLTGMLNEIIMLIGRFISKVTAESIIHDVEEINLLKEKLKIADNNILHSSKLHLPIKDIRNIVEDACNEDCISQSAIEQLNVLRINLQNAVYQEYLQTFSACRERIDSIENSFKIVHDYILMAGREPTKEEPSEILLKDFLKRYIHRANKIFTFAKITSDLTQLSDTQTCLYNEYTLHVILNSIIDNAKKHGFEEKSINKPEIHIEASLSGDYVLLKICNNGTPIEITTEEYKTRGVFSGITGHTGIGGYQISKYAELQGGYVEIPLPQKREWNTEIHLYIRSCFDFIR